MKDSKGRNLYSGENQCNDGRYRYRYTDNFGKRHAVYSWKLVPTDKVPLGKKNDISLREKENQIQKDLEDSINTYFAQSTVNELMTIYFETKVKLANSTLENYKHIWDKNIKDNKLGKMRICDVKKSDISIFYKHLYETKGFSVGTIQLYQNVLFPAFQMAVDDSIIRLNPCKNCMKEYKRGSMSSDRVSLTEDEQNALLNFIANTSSYYKRYYTLFALMLGSGLRIGEVLGLTWDNIDFDNNQIIVDHQLLYRKKDGKCQHYISNTKNGTSRNIPMQSNLCSILKKYKSENYFISLSSRYELDGFKNFVFLNSNGIVYKPESITRACHGIKEEYNRTELINAEEKEREPLLLPDFSPHVLRHTFCTRMAEKGCDIKVLQELMGHKNIQVTMQVYNHVDQQRATKEVKRLSEVLSVI